MTDNSEVKALLERIAALGNAEAQNDFLLFVGGRVGTLAESHVRQYPEEPNGRPLELFYDLTNAKGQSYKSKSKSLKQQRKVIMLYKQGKAPRGRTGQLGNSMTHVVNVADTGVVVTVGTNLNYAEPVVGDPSVQNHYHAQTGWKPLGETVSRHATDYQDEIVRSGQPWLYGYLKGDLK